MSDGFFDEAPGMDQPAFDPKLTIKPGVLVQHKLTKQQLLVLDVSDDQTKVTCRLSNYEVSNLYTIELEAPGS